MIDGFKKYSMKFLAIFITTLMLLSIVNMPVTYAYFTSGPKESDPITIEIKDGNPGTSSASAVFSDLFLKEKEEEVTLQEDTSTRTLSSTGGGAMLQGTSDSSTLDSFSSAEQETHIELSPEDTEHFQSTLIEEKEIQVEIELLDEGFHAGDIYVPSVSLEHEGNSTAALSGELEYDHLKVTFDREEVSSWFDSLEDGNKEVVFTVVGEGYKDGLHLFEFSTEAEIKLYGEFENRLIAIKGPASIVIPPDEQTVSEPFILINQDGKELEDAKWGLENSPEGVELDSENGELTIGSTAEAGEIMLTAEIEREKRLLSNKKPVELLEAPEAHIKGPSELTAPLPGKSLTETYELEMLKDFQAEELTWELQEEVDGISLSEDGEITLNDEPVEESFTILASYQLEGIQMEAEKTVDIEITRIGGVEISAKYDEDTFVIPQSENAEEDGGTDNAIENEAAQEFENDSEPADGSEPLVLKHDAEVFDPEGEELPKEKVEWLLDADSTSGLEITRDGDLIISPSADAGELIIEVYSLRDPEAFDSKTLKLEDPPEEELDEKDEGDSEDDDRGDGRGEDELPTLTIEGDELLLIPSEGEKEVVYSAEDGEGEELEGVTWKLSIIEEEAKEDKEEDSEDKEKKELKGVSIDEETGELIIEDTAEESGFTLEALLEIHLGEDGEDGENDEKESREIETITDSIEIELVHQVPSSIKEDLPGDIFIPFTADEEGIEEKTYTLKADVLNQKNKVMEEQSVTWSLAEDFTGVTLDENGELTVTDEAEPGTITLLVEIDDDVELFKELTIDLDYYSHDELQPEEPEEYAKEEEELSKEEKDEEDEDEDEDDDKDGDEEEDEEETEDDEKTDDDKETGDDEGEDNKEDTKDEDDYEEEPGDDDKDVEDDEAKKEDDFDDEDDGEDESSNDEKENEGTEKEDVEEDKDDSEDNGDDEGDDDEEDEGEDGEEDENEEETKEEEDVDEDEDEDEKEDPKAKDEDDDDEIDEEDPDEDGKEEDAGENDDKDEDKDEDDDDKNGDEEGKEENDDGEQDPEDDISDDEDGSNEVDEADDDEDEIEEEVEGEDDNETENISDDDGGSEEEDDESDDGTSENEEEPGEGDGNEDSDDDSGISNSGKDSDSGDDDGDDDNDSEENDEVEDEGNSNDNNGNEDESTGDDSEDADGGDDDSDDAEDDGDDD